MPNLEEMEPKRTPFLQSSEFQSMDFREKKHITKKKQHTFSIQNNGFSKRKTWQLPTWHFRYNRRKNGPHLLNTHWKSLRWKLDHQRPYALPQFRSWHLTFIWLVIHAMIFLAVSDSVQMGIFLFGSRKS